MRFIHALSISVLVIFGVYILYFNLVMALNVVGSNSHLTPFLGLFTLDNTRWTSDYYFGFDSILNILDSLPSSIRFDYTLEMFRKFITSLTGDPLEGTKGLLGTLQSIANKGYITGGGSIWDTIKQLGTLLFDIGGLFFEILISPFYALIAFITLNVQLFLTILDTLNFIGGILSGRYNLPMDNWTSPLSGQANSNVTTTGVPPVIGITYNGGTISYY